MVYRYLELGRDLLVVKPVEPCQAKGLGLPWLQLTKRLAQVLGQLTGLGRAERSYFPAVDGRMFHESG
jgi:hypothetical protein